MRAYRSLKQTNKIIQPQLDGIFRKSSFSAGGNCVSVAKFADGSVKVRDTKDQSNTTLTYTKDEWKAFLGGVKSGEFDV